MTTETFEVNATTRADQGKGASRRLRQQGIVPGIVYGGKGEATAISVSQNELGLHLDHEAFYSHILNLKLDGNSESVILKDLQRHPYKQRMIVHVDFQRVVEDELIHVQVPLHFLGEDVAPGRKSGGVISHQVTEVMVECLPRNLPEYIEADLSGMQIGDSIHLADLKLPQGVRLLELVQNADVNYAIVSMLAPRIEEEPAAPAAETTPPEPKS
jgi:large subunit ribosomal protein L25